MPRPTADQPRLYGVNPRNREPLIAWMCEALERSRCRVIHSSPPNEAPFRISFELPTGERMGIVAYAFLANNRRTKNRPADEHRFQVKYGTKDGQLHELWQDPFGLYTTLLVGIDPERGFFVGADPVLHSPTKFFISLEFKEEQARAIERRKWHWWERERRSSSDEPTEVLVGGTAHNFLRYVLFEREACGEDQGHRGLLADTSDRLVMPVGRGRNRSIVPLPSAERLHALAQEFELSEAEVLDLIAGAPRLKMAVRGWVAEEHLARSLDQVPGVTEAHRIEGQGEVDVSVRFNGGRPITIQCKNVLRKRTRAGLARLDFQRTRASIGDRCSRYYAPEDFHVVAACLHAVSERWDFAFTLSRAMAPHPKCPGKLSNLVRIDERWTKDPREVLRQASV